MSPVERGESKMGTRRKGLITFSHKILIILKQSCWFETYLSPCRMGLAHEPCYTVSYTLCKGPFKTLCCTQIPLYKRLSLTCILEVPLTVEAALGDDPEKLR